jgi:hypothetical protein
LAGHLPVLLGVLCAAVTAAAFNMLVIIAGAIMPNWNNLTGRTSSLFK